MKPVCRNIQNNQFYFYEGENIFKNIITGKSGKVESEQAQKIFRFSLDATQIIFEYPNVEELIKRLFLKSEKTIK